MPAVVRHNKLHWNGVLGSPRGSSKLAIGLRAIYQAPPNPRAPRLSYHPAAPLTEGCSMEAYQVVRAGLQLGRGYTTAATGLPVAA
jgi:hypothetical protein